MSLLQIAEEAVTEHQLAEGLLAADLSPTATELLAVLKAAHSHPFDNYYERWSLRHATEVLETLSYLRKIRGGACE
jgi:hypothetical protein